MVQRLRFFAALTLAAVALWLLSIARAVGPVPAIAARIREGV